MNGLAAWSKVVFSLNCGYAWGAQGEILTDVILDRLLSFYGIKKYYFDNYSVEKWLNRRCFDCSGLVVWILQQLNAIKEKDDYTSQGLKEISGLIEKEALQEGDLAFVENAYGIAKHVGIYIGENSFIHARSTKYGVVKTTYEQYPYWNKYGKIKLDVPDIHWSDPIYSMLQKSGSKFDKNKYENTPTWAEIYAALFKFATAFNLIK